MSFANASSALNALFVSRQWITRLSAPKEAGITPVGQSDSWLISLICISRVQSPHLASQTCIEQKRAGTRVRVNGSSNDWILMSAFGSGGAGSDMVRVANIDLRTTLFVGYMADARRLSIKFVPRPETPRTLQIIGCIAYASTRHYRHRRSRNGQSKYLPRIHFDSFFPLCALCVLCG